MSEPTPVLIPLINPNEPGALLAALHVTNGQHVNIGHILCTLETTKSTVDLTAEQEGYVIGFPASGTWKLRFNSDWQGYSEDFGGHPSADVVAETGSNDGLPFHATCSIGPYSVLIFSQ